MIICEQISKSYQRQIVLQKFSYKFENTGFYLLYGNSGSGKTTFLNILAGLIPFEDGTITIDGEAFSNRVDLNTMKKNSDYITQDSFFVDFLNVSDNLGLLTNEEEKKREVLEKFDLGHLYDRYPRTLSGGERQRLAIARFFLGEKKILFLDEPTASLDEGNKRMVFETLSKLKDDVLIICSSHDAVAKEYADEIIRFEKIHELKEADDIEKREPLQAERIHSHQAENKEKHAAAFLKKWFTSKQRNKKGGILFCTFLMLAISICMLADTPENKLNSNIEMVYKVNMCMLRTYGEENDLYNELCQDPEIAEVVLEYNTSVPRGDFNPDNPLQEDPDYEIGVYTLPSNENAFKLADRILYGSYFTKENQIILSAEMAESLSKNSPEKLIGQTITKKFYGIGSVEFEIVGIFDHFNDFEQQYLNAMEMYDASYFINSAFTEQYADDPNFYAGTQRGYVLYFDSYAKMKNYYDEHAAAYQEQGDTLLMGLRYGRLSGLFDVMFIVFLPLAVFIAFFSVLFYINLIKTELIYNNQFVSVFDYCGYSVTSVIREFSLLNVLHLLGLCGISTGAALVMTTIINILNKRYVFVEFQIFSYNFKMLLAFLIFICISCVFFTRRFLHKCRFSNWYDHITKQRDII